MATCNPSDLIAAAKCFVPLTKKELLAVMAQLLCNINAAPAPTPQEVFSGNYNGSAPTFTPDGDQAIAVDTSTGATWNYYSGAWWNADRVTVATANWACAAPAAFVPVHLVIGTNLAAGVYQVGGGIYTNNFTSWDAAEVLDLTFGWTYATGLIGVAAQQYFEATGIGDAGWQAMGTYTIIIDAGSEVVLDVTTSFAIGTKIANGVVIGHLKRLS